MLAEDMNKIDSLAKFETARFGGVAVILAVILSLTLTLVVRMIFRLDALNTNFLYPALLSVSLISFIGYVDDTMIFTHRPIKPILGIIASIPMMTVSYDTTVLKIFDGGSSGVDFGLLFPILFVPFFISFIANLFNIMADFDGLVPANGFIITAAMMFILFISGKLTAFFVLAPLLAAILILWKYNKYPSIVFAGETGTLGIGALLAITAIIADRKIPLLIMFIPYMVHLFLQSRFAWDKKKLFARPRERGIPQPDGTIKSEYKASYGLTHLLMRHIPKMTEPRLTFYLLAIEAIFVFIALVFELPHLLFILKWGYSALILE